MNRREFILAFLAWIGALLFGRKVIQGIQPPEPKQNEEDWIRITKRIDKHQCTPMKWKFAGSIGGRPVYCQVEDKPNFGVKVLDAD